jgi:hypothetical protein
MHNDTAVGDVSSGGYQRRNELEALPLPLKRITEIERHLRLTEVPVMPRVSRRFPLGT